MPTTRGFKSLGRIAENAVIVTEDDTPPRVPGIAYRRENLTDVPQLAGELYDEPPSTENINQKLFNMSSFTDLIDRKGTLGWSNLVNYSPTFPEGPAIVWATDGALDSGNFYFCLKPSGPSNGVGVVPVDPFLEDQDNPHKFWLLYENADKLRFDLARQDPANEGDRLVGHKGETVYDSINDLKNRLGLASHIRVLAQGSFENVPFTPLVTQKETFNLLTVVSIKQTPNGGDIYGFEITYTNPLPNNYGVIMSETFVSDINTAVRSSMYWDATNTGLKISEVESPLKPQIAMTCFFMAFEVLP